MKPHLLPLLCLAVLLSARRNGAADDEHADLRKTAHMRRPVVAALCDEGRLLCVVNQRSGSVSLIDTRAHVVKCENRLGGQLSDIAVLPDGKTLLITDETQHELLVVRVSSESLEVIGRRELPHTPVNVTVSDDGTLIAVSCLWSHRVAVLSAQGPGFESEISDPESSADIEEARIIRLPFAPRQQVFVTHPEQLGEEAVEEHSQPAENAEAASQRLVVTDAFGGRVAVIDPQLGEIESLRTLPAHNIGGMALSADGGRLLISQQVLSPLARADFDDVHWGNLLQNVVRELSVATVLDPDADLLEGSLVVRLGDVDHGAADPAGIALLRSTGVTDGELPVGLRWVQALSGVGEIVIHAGTERQRLSVGARPLDVVLDEERLVAYIVCMHDDAVAVVDLAANEVIAHISLGPQPEPTPRERGERLFFDGRRSHDGWLSCHSCHTDGHTSGGLADTLGDGSYGTAKQIPSLLGVRDTNPWGWGGRFRELHAQVRASFTSTMHGDEPDASDVTDVVAFLHSLSPPPPVDDGTATDEERDQIDHGRGLFARLGCIKCHVPPQTYTTDLVFDVGLRDEAGLWEFNPPSLRGVSQRTGFFHDSRAETLESVFTDQSHQLPRELTADEIESLTAFLRSL